MTAAAAERVYPDFTIKKLRLPLGAAVKAWKGAKACGDTSVGNVVPAKASTTLVALGNFAETVDNTAGGAGAVLVDVDLDKEIVCRWFASATGGGAVTIANLWQDVYWLDSQTVTTVSTGASKAGRVWAIDAVKGVAIENYTL